MPPHPKPRLDYSYDVEAERAELRAWARLREIPRRRRDRLLVATWNIANFGLQERRQPDHQLLAEVCSWFDIVAIQEVNDNLAGLRGLRECLGQGYEVLFSDASGNMERQAFVWDARRVRLLGKVGRLAIPPSQLDQIRLPGFDVSFRGFDRGPYMAAFETVAAPRRLRCLLINVHLYFGSNALAHVTRRAQETFAVAWWAARRQRSDHAFTKNIIPLGDFNLPSPTPGDRIYEALTARGLQLAKANRALRHRGLELPRRRAERLSKVGGTSLDGLKHYDQIAFFPEQTLQPSQVEVFDFDNTLFQELWEREADPWPGYRGYLRYYISDHRPLWAEFEL
ncbi:MAG TPA: endonuclease/exonuclease/phosphatase family protein [Solirubrobacterales bacterium]|nr:endonuclease/exonuclease/phosphatase family protein [Solirubrobacterales bacterium]